MKLVHLDKSPLFADYLYYYKKLMAPLTPTQQRLVDWLAAHLHRFGYSPGIRDIAAGLKYTSPAPVQSLVKILVRKGVLIYDERTARTIRFTEAWLRENGERYGLTTPSFQLPILGTIAAHSLVELSPDSPIEWLDLPGQRPPGSEDWFVLRVWGDSMVGALIDHNDLIIMCPISNPVRIKDGAIVAARVDTQTTLKYFYRQGSEVILKPANAAYEPTVVEANQVDIQGMYVGLIRRLWENGEP
ncbi:SOS-response transcriptional repressor, LexA [Leptolyngbya boryana IAM M-101]|jgi:repressor LexA|nr:SOS-response transcriptional repressor, LexA [Leptolyngbya boryana IAM M-101]BAS62244.1 SOS-response transcriptional repressor, LexA [Leptolyngbya boryana dg5]